MSSPAPAAVDGSLTASTSNHHPSSTAGAAANTSSNGNAPSHPAPSNPSNHHPSGSTRSATKTGGLSAANSAGSKASDGHPLQQLPNTATGAENNRSGDRNHSNSGDHAPAATVSSPPPAQHSNNNSSSNRKGARGRGGRNNHPNNHHHHNASENHLMHHHNASGDFPPPPASLESSVGLLTSFSPPSAPTSPGGTHGHPPPQPLSSHHPVMPPGAIHSYNPPLGGGGPSMAYSTLPAPPRSDSISSSTAALHNTGNGGGSYGRSTSVQQQQPPPPPPPGGRGGMMNGPPNYGNNHNNNNSYGGAGINNNNNNRAPPSRGGGVPTQMHHHHNPNGRFNGAGGGGGGYASPPPQLPGRGGGGTADYSNAPSNSDTPMRSSGGAGGAGGFPSSGSERLSQGPPPGGPAGNHNAEAGGFYPPGMPPPPPSPQQQPGGGVLHHNPKNNISAHWISALPPPPQPPGQGMLPYPTHHNQHSSSNNSQMYPSSHNMRSGSGGSSPLPPPLSQNNNNNNNMAGGRPQQRHPSNVEQGGGRGGGGNLNSNHYNPNNSYGGGFNNNNSSNNNMGMMNNNSNPSRRGGNYRSNYNNHNNHNTAPANSDYAAPPQGGQMPPSSSGGKSLQPPPSGDLNNSSAQSSSNNNSGGPNNLGPASHHHHLPSQGNTLSVPPYGAGGGGMIIPPSEMNNINTSSSSGRNTTHNLMVPPQSPSLTPYPSGNTGSLSNNHTAGMGGVMPPLNLMGGPYTNKPSHSHPLPVTSGPTPPPPPFQAGNAGRASSSMESISGGGWGNNQPQQVPPTPQRHLHHHSNQMPHHNTSGMGFAGSGGNSHGQQHHLPYPQNDGGQGPSPLPYSMQSPENNSNNTNAMNAHGMHPPYPNNMSPAPNMMGGGAGIPQGGMGGPPNPGPGMMGNHHHAMMNPGRGGGPPMHSGSAPSDPSMMGLPGGPHRMGGGAVMGNHHNHMNVMGGGYPAPPPGNNIHNPHHNLLHGGMGGPPPGTGNTPGMPPHGGELIPQGPHHQHPPAHSHHNVSGYGPGPGMAPPNNTMISAPLSGMGPLSGAVTPGPSGVHGGPPGGGMYPPPPPPSMPPGMMGNNTGRTMMPTPLVNSAPPSPGVTPSSMINPMVSPRLPFDTMLEPFVAECSFEDYGVGPRVRTHSSYGCSASDPEHPPPTMKIAVEAPYLITLLLQEVRQLDPLWFLHSAYSQELMLLIGEFVDHLRENYMEPVFVFNGLGISGDCLALVPSAKQSDVRDNIWRKLDNAELPEDAKIREGFGDLHISDEMLKAVQLYLRRVKGVEALTAPFLHWCQMIVMKKEGVVDVLFGSPDMLVIPYSELCVIIQMNFYSQKLLYLRRSTVEEELFPRAADRALAEEALMDLGLLTTTNSALTSGQAVVSFPEQLKETLENAAAMHNTGHPYGISYKDRLFDFLNKQIRSRDSRQGLNALKHSKSKDFVLFNAVVVQSNPEKSLDYFWHVMHSADQNADGVLAPSRYRPHNNLDGVLGNAVPHGLFYLQFTGLLSVSIMNVATQAYFIDSEPLVDTKEYREALPTLVAFRSQSYCQLIRSIMNSEYQRHVSSFSWVRWWPKLVVEMPPVRGSINLGEWSLEELLVETPVFDDVLPLENASESSPLSRRNDEDVWRVIREISIPKALSVDSVYCKLDRNEKCKLYYKLPKTFLAILLRSFDFMGYFTHTPPEGEGEEEWGCSTSGGAPVHCGDASPPILSTGLGIEEDVSAHSTTSPQSLLPPNAPLESEGLEGAVAGAVRLQHSESNWSASSKVGTNTFKELLRHSLTHTPREFHDPLVLFTEMVRISTLTVMPYNYERAALQEEEVQQQYGVVMTPGSVPLFMNQAIPQPPPSMMGMSEFSMFEEPPNEVQRDPAEVLLLSRIACLLSIPYSSRRTPEEQRAIVVEQGSAPPAAAELAASNRATPYLESDVDPMANLDGYNAANHPGRQSAAPMSAVMLHEHRMRTEFGYYTGNKAVLYREFEWAPLYSRHLCAFFVMARAVSRGMREMVESISAALFLRQVSSCDLYEFSQLSTVLPFEHPPNFMGGLLLHYVLVFPDDYEVHLATPADRIAHLQRKFSCIPDLRAQLERVMRFTFAALHLLQVFRRGAGGIVQGSLSSEEMVHRAIQKLEDKWNSHMGGEEMPVPEDVFANVNLELLGAGDYLSGSRASGGF